MKPSPAVSAPNMSTTLVTWMIVVVTALLDAALLAWQLLKAVIVLKRLLSIKVENRNTALVAQNSTMPRATEPAKGIAAITVLTISSTVSVAKVAANMSMSLRREPRVPSQGPPMHLSSSAIAMENAAVLNAAVAMAAIIAATFATAVKGLPALIAAAIRITSVAR